LGTHVAPIIEILVGSLNFKYSTICTFKKFRFWAKISKHKFKFRFPSALPRKLIAALITKKFVCFIYVAARLAYSYKWFSVWKTFAMRVNIKWAIWFKRKKNILLQKKSFLYIGMNLCLYLQSNSSLYRDLWKWLA